MMPVADVSFPAYYLRQVAELVQSGGGDVQGWLESAGLSTASLQQPALAFSLPGFMTFIEAAVQQAREPALGLLLGSRLLGNTHGVLSYAALNSASLRQVIGLFEQFLALRTTLVTVQQAEQGDHLQVRFVEAVPLAGIRRVALETVLLAIRNILDFITLGANPIRRTLLAIPDPGPRDRQLASELFRTEVQYAADWSGFEIPLALLDQPLKMADSAAYRDAARICEAELAALQRQVSVTARVRRLLLEDRNGFPSLPVVARLLHMTTRTLHRRLVAEGSSFADILEETRHRLAVEHLRAGRLSVQEIAYLLGYTDIANFRRAFKRWEGVPPSHYRAQPSAAQA